MRLSKSDALILVDVQNDFCPSGALAVPGGDKVAATLSRVANEFKRRGARVYASQDWHHPRHSSFKEQGGLWPPHCVQDTWGAEFHQNLRLPEGTVIVRTGTNPLLEVHSAFTDSDLERRLGRAGVGRLFIGGLATEYGVVHAVLDARQKGFETYVLTDAIAALNAKPEDGVEALRKMEKAGAKLATVAEVVGK